MSGEVPGLDTYVTGRAVSTNDAELTRIAHALGVKSILDFYSDGPDEWAMLEEDHGVDVSQLRAKGTQWYSPEEGLASLKALREHLARHSEILPDQSERVQAELQDFERVLQAAQDHSLMWHSAVDY